MSSETKRKWLCVDLPPTDYDAALKFQHRLVEARINNLISDMVIFAEHPPVFTLGRNCGLENLIGENREIPVIRAERGGNITYHGPGQLVAYPILDLRAVRLRVAEYVEHLEEVMIRTAEDFGVVAERHLPNRGVWANQRKLGSIGIAIRRSIVFHGFALNVRVCLEPFERIHPCGLHGMKMTSLERECGESVSVAQAGESAKRHFEEIFDIEFENAEADTIPV